MTDEDDFLEQLGNKLDETFEAALDRISKCCEVTSNSETETIKFGQVICDKILVKPAKSGDGIIVFCLECGLYMAPDIEIIPYEDGRAPQDGILSTDPATDEDDFFSRLG